MDAHLSIFLQHPNWSGLDYCNDLLMTLSPLVSFPVFFSLNHSHSDHTKCTSQIIFPCLNNSYNFKIKYEFFKNGAMANFMCQVGWAIGYPCIWLNILGVCVGYFWMRWTSEPADWIAAPSPICVGSIQSVGSLNKIKVGRIHFLSAFFWAGTSIFSYTCAEITISALLDLQLADCGTSQAP